MAGLRVDLSHVGTSGVRDLILIMCVAVGGKLAGGFAAARLHHLDAHDTLSLAILLNSRGLTELIVLTIGLQNGLIDLSIYSLMVVMAILTTAMTGPALALVERHRPRTQETLAGVLHRDLEAVLVRHLER